MRKQREREEEERRVRESSKGEMYFVLRLERECTRKKLRNN